MPTLKYVYAHAQIPTSSTRPDTYRTFEVLKADDRQSSMSSTPQTLPD